MFGKGTLATAAILTVGAVTGGVFAFDRMHPDWTIPQTVHASLDTNTGYAGGFVTELPVLKDNLLSPSWQTFKAMIPQGVLEAPQPQQSTTGGGAQAGPVPGTGSTAP